MARCIRPEMEAVAEIGAGTGTITRAILARGLPPARLELYELNAAFCARLRDAFPGVTVHNRPALTQELPSPRRMARIQGTMVLI